MSIPAIGLESRPFPVEFAYRMQLFRGTTFTSGVINPKQNAAASEGHDGREGCAAHQDCAPPGQRKECRWRQEAATPVSRSETASSTAHNIADDAADVTERPRTEHVPAYGEYRSEFWQRHGGRRTRSQWSGHWLPPTAAPPAIAATQASSNVFAVTVSYSATATPNVGPPYLPTLPRFSTDCGDSIGIPRLACSSSPVRAPPTVVSAGWVKNSSGRTPWRPSGASRRRCTCRRQFVSSSPRCRRRT